MAYSKAVIGLALLAGCGWADRGLKTGPSPIVGYSTGAAINTVLLIAKRPWYERLGGVAAVGFTGRFIAPKWEGWHLEVAVGGGIAEWISWFKCKGPCR